MQLARNKRAYKTNLVDLHAVCEANYARLVKLFPGYETHNSLDFSLGLSRIKIEVAERCRYTTIFRVLQQGSDTKWLGHLKIELRSYHDARMVEVGMFQSHRGIDGRYQYPNGHMYQQDEKYQQNRFMADWLEHCIHNGLGPLDNLVPGKLETPPQGCG